MVHSLSLARSRLTIVCVALVCGLAGTAVLEAQAESLQAPVEIEERALQSELERVARDDPHQSQNAQKLLGEFLTWSSKEKRELRSRREDGRRIVNGIYTFGHPAVTAVLRGNDPATAGAWCTGTLVSCDRVLTAAHCIADDPNPKAYTVFLPTAGFFGVKQISWPEAEYNFPYADLAVLTLSGSVERVTPLPINTVASPINGSIGTIVGYGRTGGNKYDYGIKREGSVKFSGCEAPFGNKKLLCWDFDAEVRRTGAASNTCNADSGGGVFMLDKVGGRTTELAVGVVSGGRDAECVKEDHSYNTDLFQWKKWLAEQGLGKRPPEVCGQSLPESLDLRSGVVTLSSDRKEVNFELNVPENTESVRVAMNGEDDGTGKNDFDLYLFRASTGSKAVCSENGVGQFAFCEAAHPAPGPWIITLGRKKGAGLAQLTVTLVPKAK
jgi:hypothetical protein